MNVRQDYDASVIMRVLYEIFSEICRELSVASHKPFKIWLAGRSSAASASKKICRYRNIDI